MGVISVGASLGVREAPAPPAPASASNSSTRRSSSSTGASSATSNGRKKSSRKRVAGASGAKKQRANYSANAARNERAASVSVAPAAPIPKAYEAAPPKPTVASVTPSVSMVINTKKPVGRMVHVKTTMDPLRLVPHVIGVNGGKLNDIMSRARCSISYRKTQSLEPKENEAFSMAFMISANTAKRVEDGVLLLQAVVESTEQQLRKYEGDMEQIQQVEGDDEVEEVAVRMETGSEHEERKQPAAEHQRIRQQTEAHDAAMQQAVVKEVLQQVARQNGEEAKIYVLTAKTTHNEQKKNDIYEMKERPAAKRARAQELLERDKYLHLRRKYEEMEHRKKVAELVVKKQCSAMIASLSTSSPSKKKQCLREIDQLIRALKAKRPDVSKLRLAECQFIASDFAEGDDLMRLVKKVKAFGKMITSGSMEPQPVEDSSVENNANHDEDRTDTFDFPCEDADISLDASNNHEAVVDASVEIHADNNEEKSSPRRDSFRSTWDLPGLTRDLNLIQDYTSETDLTIQKKLVKHQWARYYTKYQEFAPLQVQAEEDTSDPECEDKAPCEGIETQPEGEPTSESGGDATSMAIDWAGVFDPAKDPPDVIEMKKLRHEITLAKDQLLLPLLRRSLPVLADLSCGVRKHSAYDWNCNNRLLVRERRFKINPVAAQRRGSNLPTNEGEEASPASAHGRNNGEPPPAFTRSRGPLPTFDYGIEGAFGLGPMDQRGQCRTWRPAPSDKNEQEDLFRAARVRMKLVRSTFAKSMGSSSGSGCLDGEQLWQPERIRMMWERRDFHGVLGLPRDATTQQIKRQYRKLALKLHPDKASDASASLESTVAEAGKDVGAGNSGKRVDAFVAATHSYKILLGDDEQRRDSNNMDVNRIFSAEQIAVPPDLPHMLKDWTKAVIRENPTDLLAFSQQWFQDKATQVSQRKAVENQIRRMRQLFESYDVDGQGRMEAKDLGKFLGEDLGMDGYEDGSPAELLEDLVMELDPDNTGFVELHDIIQWYQQR
ncbi:hypothetical protein JG688_00011333 [Phytophthora aleatoria]|uniref:Uncharacterized protein n=1 Tax=Phytophthora aleatoria TaxID=2496075 RepID=A0A8J5J0P0_9STRA|nr:hypothetical protein JG688_00011333 [Phytophthora aleatoria]